MKNVKRLIVVVFICLLPLTGFAQETSSNPQVGELPEYIVVTSENTKLIGGINISIDYKKSNHRKQLMNLESMLQDGKRLKVRCQTDLLNAMSKLGFEYVNGYNSRSIGLGAGNDVSLEAAKFRTNMVFRKKEQFRN